MMELTTNDFQITLFTADWCQPCKVLKNRLKQENIPFIERDISIEEVRIDASELGIKSVPYIIINGATRLNNPDYNQLISVLSELGWDGEV